VIALENLPRINRALGIAPEEAKRVAKTIKQKEILPEDEGEALANLLGQWLRFYGPVLQEFLLSTLELPVDRLSAALQTLLDEDRILIDEFRADAEGVEEICETENLEILLRMRRSKARPDIEPKEVEELPLFLAAYQRLTSPGDNLEDLQDSLENLFGYPARPGMWETDIFPARLSPFYNSWLDTALRENELLWFGCGTERVGFCFESDYELFREKKQEDVTYKYKDAAEALEKVLVETRGKFDLADLAQATHLTSMELTTTLWEMVWQGRVSNDHFKTLRNGVMTKFKPQQPPPVKRSRPGRGRFNINRWQNTRSFTGNWFALPGSTKDDPDDIETLDALDRQEIVKDRIRQLFLRYGILFRELLWNELPALRWSRIFPVLRLMELSGEVVSGHFFKGIPGLQFCTPAALGLFNKGLPEDAIFWMNATDPASPCGMGLEQLKPLFPHRLPTTHLVFHGHKPVLVSKKNGKELLFNNVEPGHPRIAEYLEFFNTLVGREFQPLKYVGVEIVNDLPVLESPYKQVLHSFGFKKDYKAMTLMKKY
jgi:ATP-dependent Lhr-like helicase